MSADRLLWHLLTRPQGPVGSARARYGAAMALHAEGKLEHERLEAYREASAFDDQDPARVLADRGLDPPKPHPLHATDLCRILLAEIDRLLAATPGPGIAETRAGLAPAFQREPRPDTAQANPVADRWLPSALDLLEPYHPALTHAISAAAPHLSWITYDAYDAGLIGPEFPRAHAFASLVGEDAPIAAHDFDLGLFLIAPGVLYRDHAHPAPELYLPLTGPHRWRFAPGSRFRAQPAFDPVWNPPGQPHATLVGTAPFLSLYAWTHDVNLPAHIIPADDWSAYERKA